MFSLLSLIIVVVVALLGVLGIIRGIKDNKLMKTVTDASRGTYSERKLVVSLLRHGIPAEDIYHDLYLEYRLGYYSQIDVVTIVPQGIIVFEEKDYSGWIFGTGWQKQWTQVLNYGKEKYRIYNPIKQNETHIQKLKDALGLAGQNIRYFPVIIFHGSCELHNISEVPPGVIIGYGFQVGSILKAIGEEKAAYFKDDEAIRRVLRQAVRNGKDPSVISKHQANVRKWKDF